jgi:hypothetical protein
MANMTPLAEHAAPDVDTASPVGYEPSDEEKRAIRLVERLFEKAKKHRKQYDEKWLDYYKMFRGKQWKEARPSYRHSEVINMVFQTIQSTVPIQTDSRPRISFLPQDPSDLQLADILNKVCESDWERYNWLQTLTESIYDANFYGTGFGSMEVEAEGDNGLPRICYEAGDPFYSYPDPNARNVNERRSRYFIYAEPIDVSVLKREYPDKKDFFKPDLLDMKQMNRAEIAEVSYKSPVDTGLASIGGDHVQQGHKDQALKLTAWLLSDDFDEVKKDKVDASGQTVIDPVTGEPQVEFEQKLKYPKGRKIVVACGVLCEDVPNPYDDGKFPVSRLLNYSLPREFWGLSEVEQLEGPQRTFNKILNFALDCMTAMGNPIWVVADPTVDTDNLVNRPGLVVETDDPSKVRREPGTDINPSVFQIMDRLRSWFNDVSGSQDITRGAKPEGVSAASAINMLQEAAQTRLRLKARHLDAHVQELGQMYASRVFQFYDAPRIFRLTNDAGAPQFFKMHIETVPNPVDPLAPPIKKAVVRGYVSNPVTGAMTEELEAKEFQVKADFDVRCTTGSSLPFAKQEKFAQAEKLFGMGLYDAQAVYEAADIPNWQAIQARMQQAQMEQMQAQAAMAPPPAGPGGAPPPPAPMDPNAAPMPMGAAV